MNTNFKFYLLTCAICILLFITILAPYIVPFDPYEQNLANTLQAPVYKEFYHVSHSYPAY